MDALLDPPTKCPRAIHFGILSAEEIRRFTVLQITSPECFDSLGHPVPNGLYDVRMGPVDKAGRCGTCAASFYSCPGHCGRIELPVVVYSPMTLSAMYQVLRACCFGCGRWKASALHTALLSAKLKVLREGEGGVALRAIHDLDSLLHTPAPKSSSLGHQSSVMEVEEEENMAEGESEATILKRIHAFTKQTIASHPKSPPFEEGGRGGEDGEEALVTQTRKSLIAQWFKDVGGSSGRACQHCRAPLPKLHRHGQSRIFQSSRALASSNKASNIPENRAKVSQREASASASSNTVDASDDSQASSSDSSELDDGDDDKNPKKPANKPGSEPPGISAIRTADSKMTYLTPLHVQSILQKLWHREHESCALIYGDGASWRMFFVEVLAVPPSRFRPPAILGEQQFEHPANSYYAEIVRLGERILAASKSNPSNFASSSPQNSTSQPSNPNALMHQAWLQLQDQVTWLMDSARAPAVSGGKQPPAGIRQLLEKKEGLFRKHMMGKRVNYAARSVISPDPCIGTEEIGVPLVFATKLTFPEPVTRFNCARLAEAVRAGPCEHPGATQVHEGSAATILEHLSPAARSKLADRILSVSTGNVNGGSDKNTIVVHRHIRDGDAVLMNRQPTLHKPSMMAHRVKVLRHEKTLRMHYANCNTYNADFDGDEMNLHFHQGELARAEAYGIAANSLQYLVPTSGSPLRGLIQDHIVTGVIMCLKDTWLTKDDYAQLLYTALPSSDVKSRSSYQMGVWEGGRQAALNTRITVPPPTVLHPLVLWSGKQLLQGILANLGCLSLTLTAKGKIKEDLWGPSHSHEATLLLLDGYVVHGVLDKAQLGAAEDGLTHAIHDIYGAHVAAAFLTAMARLLTGLDEMWVGFTCRMDDLLLNAAGDRERQNLLLKVDETGLAAARSFLQPIKDGNDAAAEKQQISQLMEEALRHDELQRGLDASYKGRMGGVTSQVIKACLPHGQLLPFPANNMSMMTVSGAKGSAVNHSQIAGCLGQQELEGRRVPVQVSGKTLPSFPPLGHQAEGRRLHRPKVLVGHPAARILLSLHGRQGGLDRHGRQDQPLGLPSALPDQTPRATACRL